MIRAVVFDLDDTLYDERQFVLGGFKAVAQFLRDGYGLPLFIVMSDKMYWIRRMQDGEQGSTY